MPPTLGRSLRNVLSDCSRAPDCSVDPEEGIREREYRADTAARCISVGRLASILSSVIIPLFTLQDYLVLDLRVLGWRVLGFVPMVAYLAATLTILPRRRRLAAPLYALALTFFMAMSAGITGSVFADPEVGEHLRYLALNSLVVSMIGVFTVAAGARPYLPAVLFGPLAVLVAFLAFSARISLRDLANFSNPAAVALVLTATSAFQERFARREFNLRRLAERRKEERIQAEDRARESRQIIQSFLDSIGDRAFVIDEEGRLVFANHAFASSVGKSKEEVIGARLEEALPAAYAKYGPALAQALGAGAGPIKAEIEDGDAVFEYTIYPVVAREGRVAYVGAIGKDVTERVSNERRLEYCADHDPLTGLYNRRFLLDRVSRAIALARRGTPSSILYMDVDAFKEVNDRFGHEAGDLVLKDVALIVAQSIRDGDAAFRVGGDEFAVVLEDLEAEDARRIAERLRSAVWQHDFAALPSESRVGISIGMAEVEGGDDAERALGRADAAMYRAKRGGKNRVVVSDPEGTGRAAGA